MFDKSGSTVRTLAGPRRHDSRTFGHLRLVQLSRGDAKLSESPYHIKIGSAVAENGPKTCREADFEPEPLRGSSWVLYCLISSGAEGGRERVRYRYPDMELPEQAASQDTRSHETLLRFVIATASPRSEETVCGEWRGADSKFEQDLRKSDSGIL